MAGYTRNDTGNNIADGNIINASDLDGEYDAIQAAFDASTGHTHDGTTGEGAPIEVIGPTQDVVATASALRPKTDNTVDLGTTTLEYKDLFIDGTAHIDTLDVDENASITGTLGVTGTTTLGTANITTANITTTDINGGTIDGTTIGGTTPAAVTGTTITGTSFVTTGNMTFGDNDKAIFGAGSDLQIYHDGSDSYVIENGAGNLILQTVNGANIQLDGSSGEMARFKNGAGVDLYYDNSPKFSTTATGVDVTGTITSDGAQIGSTTADATAKLTLGKTTTTTEASLPVIYSGSYIVSGSGNDAVIESTSSSGGVVFRTGNPAATRAVIASNGDLSLYEDTGTTPKFFWDASAESLGIGTTSPDSSLHVEDAGAFPITLTRSGGTDTNTSIRWKQATTSWYAGVNSANSFAFKYNSSDLSTANALAITSSGNVGIGTTSPSSVLHIRNNDATVILDDANNGTTGTSYRPHQEFWANGTRVGSIGMTDSTNLEIIADNYNSASINFDTGGSERMRITSTGLVGIGTTSPATPLHIGGTTNKSVRIDTAQGNSAFYAGWEDTARMGVNRNPATGTATDTNKAAAEIAMQATSGDAFITFGTTSSNNGTPSERVRINSSGNVGIGTTNPAAKLDVVDSMRVGAVSGPAVFLQQNEGGGEINLQNNSGNTKVLIDFLDADNDGEGLLRILNLSSSDGGVDIGIPQANSDGTINFFTNGSQRAQIDASGNLGVGTSAPSGKVSAERASASAGWAYHAKATGVTNDSGFYMTASNNFEVVLRDASSNLSYITNTGNNLAMFVNSAERARIDSGGILLVGTSSTFDSVSSLKGQFLGGVATKINTTGATSQMSFFNPNGRVGFIGTSGTSTTYNTSSDYRLKEDVQPMVGSVDRLMALKPVNFAWKTGGSRVDGFLAHEAQEVVPEAVTGEKDGEEMQAIDHSKLVPLLTAALQEALTKIEALEVRLNALEGQ